MCIRDSKLLGAAGDDFLQGGLGQDALDGGEGRDIASYENATRPIVVDLRAGFAQGAGSDAVISIESVIGSPFSDYLRGDLGDNVIHGASGDDVLEGREGHDELHGDDGSDTADGGDDNDVCVAEYTTFCE